ncbi:MAG: MFS transporter [Nanoarchaeota archaeon]
MGILLKKRKAIEQTGNINKIAYVNLFIALSTASITTIWALYINSFVGSTVATGFVSGFLTLISFISFFAIIPLIEKSNKNKLVAISLSILIIFYIILSINKSFYIFLLIAVILTITQTIRLTTIGIIVKNKSQKGQLIQNEGLIYTFLNLGWVIGPLIGGYVAARFRLNSVFLIGAIFITIALLIFKSEKIKDGKIKKKTDNNIIKNFKDFFRNKERIVAYFINGGSLSWWILIYLFVPIHIVNSGLGAKFVGYFLFAVALPLILTEYKLAKLTSKYGFKKMFRIGISITIVFTIIAFFLTNIYLILLSLIFAAFGMAILEPTAESYFLEILKENEISRFYGPFYTTHDLNQFVIKIISSLILLTLPFKFLFLFFSLMLFIMLILTMKMKEVTETDN